ncbi:MAG: SGNH/GDSL hydrolase family protein [Cyclobacteriaceae bacterium]
MKNINLLYSIIFILAATACSPELEDVPVVQSGEADFSNYIAVGNSLTAGFRNNGLYPSAQETSYPNFIAQQMQQAGGGEFLQPLMPAENGSGYLKLTSLTLTDLGTSFTLTPQAPAPDAFAKVSGDFNNLGIPGMRVIDMPVEEYALANPYLNRILASGEEASTSYLEHLATKQPTFFTAWIGNNDALGYATSGGIAGESGAPETYLNGFTPTNIFAQSYGAMMTTLTNGGAKGVIATIPDVLDVPYFNVFPAQLIPITSQTNVDQLNAAYADYNQGVEAINAATGANLNKIIFQLGANYPVVEDPSIPDPLPKFSQLQPGGKLLLSLSLDSVMTGGWGTQKPIPNQFSLTTNEIALIEQYIDDYNDIIAQFADGNNVVLFNTNELFGKFLQGQLINGVTYTPAFINGGIFSLDGVHLTAAANAIVANEMIATINEAFGSTLPPVVVSEYERIPLP